jgi:predicted ester cyclase
MSETATLEAHKATANRFTEIINTRDYDTFPEVCQPNMVRHCPATPEVRVRSIEDMVAFLEEDLKAVPDSRVELKMLVAEGELMGYWANYSGTQEGQMGPFPPSGKRIDCDFAGLFRFEDGKIAEIWVTWDNIGILAGLEHITPPGAGE